MLNMRKYGKLALSAYIMKKMKSGRSPGSKGILRKYAKLALGAYLLNKLKSEKPEKEIEIEIEPEEEIMPSGPIEIEKGRKSLMRIGKITLGVLAGAAIIYALKKQAAKKSGYRIEME
ncbi:MAG: hypothetical protein GX302_10465 [Methanosarcina flavescens]|uniref:Uncharacterized protein n=2 Tax=Methanosarcina flavescens TaxID=1715806 RepID=A0A660HV35_9EURY|nr:hypothetical protein AOB57_012915 [Methanosarcina flavescens]NLK33222.1 hypothetical protein [Methanosarcina flavescens]